MGSQGQVNRRGGGQVHEDPCCLSLCAPAARPAALLCLACLLPVCLLQSSLLFIPGVNPGQAHKNKPRLPAPAPASPRVPYAAPAKGNAIKYQVRKD